MRRLPSRNQLDNATLTKLAEKTNKVIASAEPKILARNEFKACRSLVWFAPVVAELKRLSGAGGCCMWCSAGESSHVEHYRPIATFPEMSFVFENYLWSCGICNTRKGARFDSSAPPINPLDEDPWQFFFIDDLGLLVIRADIDEKSQRRARATIEMVGLDRDELDVRRRSALRKLRHDVNSFLTSPMAERSSEWVARRVEDEVHQPDVVQFFLLGPGRSDGPFSGLDAK